MGVGGEPHGFLDSVEAKTSTIVPPPDAAAVVVLTNAVETMFAVSRSLNAREEPVLNPYLGNESKLPNPKAHTL